MIKNNYPMIAKTFFGLENILAEELTNLGAENVEILKRAVKFEGDKALMYSANYNCRTALKILKPIAQFPVNSADELFDKVFKIDWHDYFDIEKSFSIDVVANKSVFNNTQFIAQKTKDAIVDKFRQKYGNRPSVDTKNPDISINVHIYETECSISLDSSGEPLFKRGYRLHQGKAPLNEVLAAGLIYLSEWNKTTNFVDFMCGSGTLLIEAALMARNYPSQYFRKSYSFENWKNFDERLWNMVKKESNAQIVEYNGAIVGCDKSEDAVEMARENVENIKFQDIISIENCLYEDLDVPEGKGTLIINPPYNERIKQDDMEAFYAEIGDVFKKKYAGYRAGVISAAIDAVKRIGLKPSRKFNLYNGPIECKYLLFDLYEGTKRVKKD